MASESIKRVVAINDMSCFGKCSLTVALPVVSAFGVEAVPLPTAILSTHTGGFTGYSVLNMTDEMQKIIAHWSTIRFKCDGIFSGYLCGEKQIDIVCDFIDSFASDDTLILVDPVMADNGKFYYGFDESFRDKMRVLVKKADVITPNLTEACFLTGVSYHEIMSEEGIRDCLDGLKALGVKRAVITGVMKADKTIGYVCADFAEGKEFEIFYPMEDYRLHGCGDVVSSVLCGGLVKGDSFESSVKRAADFTERCIKATGADIENHWYGLKFEKELQAGI